MLRQGAIKLSFGCHFIATHIGETVAWHKTKGNDMGANTTRGEADFQIAELKVPVLFLIGLFALVALVSQLG